MFESCFISNVKRKLLKEEKKNEFERLYLLEGSQQPGNGHVENIEDVETDGEFKHREADLSWIYVNKKIDFISMALRTKTDVGKARQRAACKLTPRFEC